MMAENIIWKFQTIEEMSSTHLYKMLQLRSAVFVIEQTCIYQDMDDIDLVATLLTGMYDEEIVACTRIISPVHYNGYSSIGRVCTKIDYRALKIGKVLMDYSIKYCLKEYPRAVIKISAQQYLIKFYTELGFKVIAKGYLEDDIPHIGMIYDKHLHGDAILYLS